MWGFDDFDVDLFAALKLNQISFRLLRVNWKSVWKALRPRRLGRTGSVEGSLKTPSTKIWGTATNPQFLKQFAYWYPGVNLVNYGAV